jgi:hypothetical protein
MKILINPSVYGLLSLFLFILSGCGNEETVTENMIQKKPEIKIKLKKKQEIVKSFDFEDGDSSLIEIVTDKFDTAGNLTFELIQDHSGTTIGSQRLVYNEKGKLIESVYLDSPVYMETVKIKYDEKGEPVEEIKEIEQNHIPQLKLVTIHKNGKPSEKTEYNGDGKKNWHDVFSWSDNFKKLEKKGYDGDGKLLFTSAYTYNEKGDELTHIKNSANGDRNKKITDYTGDGKVFTVKYFHNDTLTYVQSYKYDNLGNRIEYTEMSNEDPSVSSQVEGMPVKVKYKYYHNENGDEVIMERFNDKNILIRKVFFEYEYYGVNP